MSSPIIERPTADPVFLDVTKDGNIELRIGRPIRERFQIAPSKRWFVANLLERGASLAAVLSPAEARIVGHALLAAADMAQSSN